MLYECQFDRGGKTNVDITDLMEPHSFYITAKSKDRFAVSFLRSMKERLISIYIDSST